MTTDITTNCMFSHNSAKSFSLCSYLEESPHGSFKLVSSCIDLFLAETHKASWAQSCLQLFRALQKRSFCHDLADVHNAWGGLLRLLRVRLCVLQRNQLPSKLGVKKYQPNVSTFKTESLMQVSVEIQKQDSQQTRLLQVCGSTWVVSLGGLL